MAVGVFLFVILVLSLLGAGLGCLIGAIFMRAAWRVVFKENLSYNKASETLFLAFFINGMIQCGVAGAAMQVSQNLTAASLASFLTLPFAYLILASMISHRHQISFSKASEVSAWMIVLYIVIALVSWGVVAFAMALMAA